MNLFKAPTFGKPLTRSQSQSPSVCPTRGQLPDNKTTKKQPTTRFQSSDQFETRQKLSRSASVGKTNSRPPIERFQSSSVRTRSTKEPRPQIEREQQNKKDAKKNPKNIQSGVVFQQNTSQHRWPSPFRNPQTQSKNQPDANSKTLCFADSQKEKTQSEKFAVNRVHSSLVQGRKEVHQKNDNDESKIVARFPNKPIIRTCTTEQNGESLIKTKKNGTHGEQSKTKAVNPIPTCGRNQIKPSPKKNSTSVAATTDSQLRFLRTNSNQARANGNGQQNTVQAARSHTLPFAASKVIQKPKRKKTLNPSPTATRANDPLKSTSTSPAAPGNEKNRKGDFIQADKVSTSKDETESPPCHPAANVSSDNDPPTLLRHVSSLHEGKGALLQRRMKEPDTDAKYQAPEAPTPISSFSSKYEGTCSFRSSKCRRRNRRRQDCHRDIGEWMNAVDAAVAEIIMPDTQNPIEPASALLTARQHLGTLVLLTTDTNNSTLSASHDIQRHCQTGRNSQSPAKRRQHRLSPFTNVTMVSKPPGSVSTRKSPSTPRILKVRESLCRKSPLPFGSRRLSPCPIDSASSFSLTSIIRCRGYQRRASQASASLLRGIRMRNPTAVKEALEKFDADPNEYFNNIPTIHLPWNILAPFHYHSLESSPSSRNIPAYIRCHPLHLAVAISSYSVVRTLINYGCCINALDSFNRNPLHVLVQSPPIELQNPEIHGSQCCTWPPRRTDTIDAHLTDNVLLYGKLWSFLKDQTASSNNNESKKIASLLCNKGVDITRSDIYGRRCVDHATDWLRICRLIRSGQIRPNWIKASGRIQNHCIPREPIIDCPIPIDVQPDTESVNLLDRVPHSTVDIVLTYEDQLRLLAMAPIVGLNVGGQFSPHQFVRINGKPLVNDTDLNNIVKVSQRTPTYCTPEAHPNRNIPSTSEPADGNTSLFQSSNIRSGNQYPTQQSTRRFILSQSRHGAISCLHATEITISSASPGVTQLALRLNPCAVQTIKPTLKENSGLIPSQNSLAESCLRALKRSVVNQRSTLDHSSPPIMKHRSPQPHCKEIPTNDDDLELFLKLASSSKYRCHSALLTVWEFLGASVFSPLTENSPSITSDYECEQN